MLIVELALAAACLAVAWVRLGGGRMRSPSVRLRELAWCAALLAVVLMAVGAPSNHGQGAIALLLAAAALCATAPRLAGRLLPPALIVTGLYGVVVGRIDVFGGYATASYGLLHAGYLSTQGYLVLPEAYAFLLLGGWLSWRMLSRLPGLAARVLGRAWQPGAQAPWSLLLLPAVLITVELLSSGLYLTSALACMEWIAALLLVPCLVIRRAPRFAAAAATALLGLMGVAGFFVARTWSAADGWTFYGVLGISTRPIALAAYAEGLVFLAGCAWLAPRTLKPWLGRVADGELTQRVRRLTETRTVAVDSAAAELRRLERDLHDGAQAQLVALGMSLRAAEQLVPDSPQAALALIGEAKQASARALTDLRNLVRGIYPPVLADRGLADAVRALALDTPISTSTDIELPGRVDAPLEAACYFAVAATLTNVIKHACAKHVDISIRHDAGVLRISVIDDGAGGADPCNGRGLAGLEGRLAAFDGILAVSSPVGGPTVVAIEVPCALSSQKISTC